MSEGETAAKPGTVLVIGGPVGAGKSTVAHELVERWSGPLACIEGDRFWSFIPRPISENRRPDFVTLIRSMLLASAPLARSGYDVIVDFSIPPGFLPAARKIVKELGLAYVVLLPSLAACETRARARDEGSIAEYGRFRHLYDLFAEWAADPGNERHVIRNDALEPAAVVDRILAGFGEGRFRVG